jgi:hypothetical protein
VKTLKKNQSPEKLEEFPCVVCGKPLRSTSEATECSFCGKTEKADYVCEERHYICEVGYACGFASSIIGVALWDTISIAQRARPKSLTLEKGNLGTR